MIYFVETHLQAKMQYIDKPHTRIHLFRCNREPGHLQLICSCFLKYVSFHRIHILAPNNPVCIRNCHTDRYQLSYIVCRFQVNSIHPQ